MKIARVAVLGVALGAGLLAWSMARNLGANESEGPIVVQQAVDTEQVLVAARDIEPGRLIASSDLKWQTWPSDAVNGLFISKSRSPGAVEQMTGSIARSALSEGEPIRGSKLVKAGAGGYLSAVLPSGMRAVSTRTSPQTGAGGFILPNDRVDVILTRRDTASGTESFTSHRVLENVRILAIDQTIEEQQGKMVVVGNVATLELKPEQTEVLALAEQLGDISLALRSIMDGSEGAEGSGPVTSNALIGGRRSGAVSVVKFGVPSSVRAN